MAASTAEHIARHYSKMQIETASKSKAVSMLHHGCVMVLMKAQLNTSERAASKIKAQNILSQLQRSLKISDPLSRSLFYLYDYCYVCLEKDDVDSIGNVVSIMSVLHDTFRILVRRPV